MTEQQLWKHLTSLSENCAYLPEKKMLISHIVGIEVKSKSQDQCFKSCLLLSATWNYFRTLLMKKPNTAWYPLTLESLAPPGFAWEHYERLWIICWCTRCACTVVCKPPRLMSTATLHCVRTLLAYCAVCFFARWTIKEKELAWF